MVKYSQLLEKQTGVVCEKHDAMLQDEGIFITSNERKYYTGKTIFVGCKLQQASLQSQLSQFNPLSRGGAF